MSKEKEPPKFTVYMGGQLTNRTKDEILKEHEPIREMITKLGGAYEDPFEKEEGLFKKRQRCGFEGVKQSISEVVHVDKDMIKRSDVLLHMTGDIASFGSLWECGYTRYWLVKPIVAIAPKHKNGETKSWHTVEVDYLAQTAEEAIEVIADYWGTPEKRLVWKCKILAEHGRAEDTERTLQEYFKLKQLGENNE